MPSHNYDCGTLTIANGASVSGGLSANPHFRYAEELTFYLPSTLTNVQLKVQVSEDAGTTYFDLLDDNGNNVTAAPSEAVRVRTGGWDNIRLAGAVTEGSARTVNVTAREMI